MFSTYRFRWSSVLAFSTQVCGFKPGRSLRIFRAKLLSTPSFGGEVKLSVPCRRFTACKRSLNLRGSPNSGKITTGHLSRPQFHISLLGSLASLRLKWERLKVGGEAMANYPQECDQDAVCQSHTGHMTGLWFLLMIEWMPSTVKNRR